MLLMQDRMRQKSRFGMAVKLFRVMRSFLSQVPLLKSLCHLHNGFETPAGSFRFNFVVSLSLWSSLCSPSLTLCAHKGQGMEVSVRLMCLSFVQTIRRCLVPLCWKFRASLAVQMSFSSLGEQQFNVSFTGTLHLCELPWIPSDQHLCSQPYFTKYKIRLLSTFLEFPQCSS